MKTASGLSPAVLHPELSETVNEDRRLAPLSRAVRLLATATDLSEFTEIHSVASAVEAYARAEKLGDEAELYAREIRLRAARGAGERLREMAASGERFAHQPGINTRDLVVTGLPGPQTLKQLGLTKTVSSRWQKLALVPSAEFEAAVKSGKGETAIARERRSTRPAHPKTVEAQHGKRTGPTTKQSLNGLVQAAVALQSLGEGMDGGLFGDWALLYDIEEAQPWFEILAESLPLVSARIRRVLKDRGEAHDG